MDPMTAMALAQVAMQAAPPLIDLLTGRSRRIAKEQGRPFSVSDVFFGAPQLREPFMAEGGRQYADLLKSMGPFAQQLMSGRPDAFSPLYQQAMQRFQTETAPQIASMFGGRGGTRYSGAMDAALAQAGRMMGTDLAAQQMQAQMGLLQTLLGGMPGMRQVGEMQQERPGIFQMLATGGRPGSRSPLEQIAASGFNALFPSGPTAQQSAPTMPAYSGGYGF